MPLMVHVGRSIGVLSMDDAYVPARGRATVSCAVDTCEVVYATEFWEVVHMKWGALLCPIATKIVTVSVVATPTHTIAVTVLFGQLNHIPRTAELGTDGLRRAECDNIMNL
eukprot:1289426-Amphidinium_carterae.1